MRRSLPLLAAYGVLATVAPGLLAYAGLRWTGLQAGLAGVVALLVMMVAMTGWIGWLFAGGGRG